MVKIRLLLILICLVLTVATGCGNSNDSGGDFCSTHDCISNFDNGNGYVIQCADGTYSHSGGIQGSCSHHGGNG
jgi:hypothetical protein